MNEYLGLVNEITERVINKLKESDEMSNNIPIGISARHLHLTQENADIIFGKKGYELVLKKWLIGGDFASEDTVTVVSAEGKKIEKVRVLGPYRKFTQLEISGTDAIKLGIKPPYRQSGDVAGSAPIKIIGPGGEVDLPEGCIIAKTHIHMHPTDAENLGVKDKELVDVRFTGERSGVLEDVLCRVSEAFPLEMHVDTDEANALALNPNSIGQLIKKG